MGPFGILFKKFSPAQTNYSTYDRELIAIYHSIKFFRLWIEDNTEVEIHFRIIENWSQATDLCFFTEVR